MKKAKAIELLKLAVPIKALTQQEYSDFVEAVNMGMDALEQPTSPDTIDRQAAIDALDCINGVEEVLRSLPPIQPERAEGEWIRTDCGLDVECKCSVCGYKDFVSMHDTYWFNRNYCPNCGADMRGEQDGNA